MLLFFCGGGVVFFCEVLFFWGCFLGLFFGVVLLGCFFFKVFFLLFFVLDPPHCHNTALVFNLHTGCDIDSDGAHNPLFGLSESCAQDTEQKRSKHGSGTPLSSFFWRERE